MAMTIAMGIAADGLTYGGGAAPGASATPANAASMADGRMDRSMARSAHPRSLARSTHGDAPEERWRVSYAADLQMRSLTFRDGVLAL